MTSRTRKSAQDYHIVWIAALPIERSAASEMLDEVHDEPSDFIRSSSDENAYDWGQIHDHNLVITSLPSAIYGKANAAHTIAEVLASLPHIKIGLLVGIGAGLPNARHDIRLGDVVVSQPEGSHGGVIQYDLGKANGDGSWEPKGFLQPPPMILLKALSDLQAKHESGQFRMAEFLFKAMRRNEYWAKRFGYPVGQSNCIHASETSSVNQPCNEYCKERDASGGRPIDPVIHFGTIASGDTLVKNVLTRDVIPTKIRQHCLCVEMEAAGLLSKFPCLVIRGISDYADSNKNDDWQRYASATAAAFAKELLLYVPVSALPRSRNAAELMELHRVVQQLRQSIETTQHESHASRMSKLLQSLYTCPYAERKDRNIQALNGTCQWFVNHQRFWNWNNPQSDTSLLWVSADPGCGKSVLSRYLIDEVLCANKDHTICYFFFKDDFADQRSCHHAMSAVVRQLLIQRPELQQQEILLKFAQDGEKLNASFHDLWTMFLALSSKLTTGLVICVLDALDECQQSDRVLLVQTLSSSYHRLRGLRVKFLITSRPYGEIKDIFHNLTVQHPTIYLSGESEHEAEQISHEIGIVIRHRIRELSRLRYLTSEEEAYIIQRFTSIGHRTYLWAHLTMNIIESTPGLTKGHVKLVLDELPRTVYEAYEKILDRSADAERTRLLLQILLAAERPLFLKEVSLLLCMKEHHQIEDFADIVEPDTRFKQSVRDLCGLFVIVVDGRVYFLHQTAREFLVQTMKESTTNEGTTKGGIVSNGSSKRWGKSIRLADSHCKLVERCLWFMFTAGARDYDDDFFSYCNNFWTVHYAGADEFDVDAPINEMVLHIFTTWSNLYGNVQLENLWNIEPLIKFGRSLPRIIEVRCCSPIAFATFFGFRPIIILLLRRQSSQQDKVQIASSALWWASLTSNPSLIMLLLSCGANPNTNCLGYHGPLHRDKTIYWDTPLMRAIQNNSANAVRLLVEGGADVNMLTQSVTNESQHTTPLWLACFNINYITPLEAHVNLLEVLLLHGADIDAPVHFKSQYGRPWANRTSTPRQVFQERAAHKHLSSDVKRRLHRLLSWSK